MNLFKKIIFPIIVFFILLFFISLNIHKKNKNKDSFIPITEMTFCEAENSFLIENSSGLEIKNCSFKKKASWNFGFTNKVIWVKIKLSNLNEITEEKVLLINHIYLSKIKIYEKNNNNNFIFLNDNGLDIPLKNEDSSIAGFKFNIQLPPKSEKEIFIRVQSKFPISVPIQLMSIGEYSK